MLICLVQKYINFLNLSAFKINKKGLLTLIVFSNTVSMPLYGPQPKLKITKSTTIFWTSTSGDFSQKIASAHDKEKILHHWATLIEISSWTINYIKISV